MTVADTIDIYWGGGGGGVKQKWTGSEDELRGQTPFDVENDLENLTNVQAFDT